MASPLRATPPSDILEPVVEAPNPPDQFEGSSPATATVWPIPRGLTVPNTIIVLSIAVATALLLLPAQDGFSSAALKSAGVAILFIGLWCTGKVPEYVTVLGFFLIAVIFEVAPAPVIFSGFATSAVWLVLAGLILSAAALESGLAGRLVEATGRVSRFSYGGIIAFTVLVTIGACFFIPSAMGRAVLLVPLAALLAERCGFEAGSRGHEGMVLATAISSALGAYTILPATVPNIAMLGTAETLYGVRMSYTEYLLVNFPVLGGVLSIATILVIAVMCRDKPQAALERMLLPEVDAAQRRLAMVLCVTVILWATDFVHGVSPAWVALGAAIFCLLPRVGVLPSKAVSQKINFAPWFIFAAIVGMGAMVSGSGLGNTISSHLVTLLGTAPGESATNFAALIGVGKVVSTLTTTAGSPAILTPFAEQLASATGWSLKSVVLLQVPAWMITIIPYESPPLAVGVILGGVAVSRAIRVLVPIALIMVSVALPLHFLWLQTLGYLP